MEFSNLLSYNGFSNLLSYTLKCKRIVIFYFSYNSYTCGKNVLPLILRDGYSAFRAQNTISNILLNLLCIRLFPVFSFRTRSQRTSLLKIILRYQASRVPLFSSLLFSRVSTFYIVDIFFAVGFSVVASRIGSQSNEICPLTNLSLIHFDKSFHPLIKNFSNRVACTYDVHEFLNRNFAPFFNFSFGNFSYIYGF